MPSEQSLAPMSDSTLTTDPGYQALVDRISAVYAQGQLQAHWAVNEHLTRARQFYLAYPKGATLPHLLCWTHAVELPKLSNNLTAKMKKTLSPYRKRLAPSQRGPTPVKREKLAKASQRGVVYVE